MHSIFITNHALNRTERTHRIETVISVVYSYLNPIVAQMYEYKTKTTTHIVNSDVSVELFKYILFLNKNPNLYYSLMRVDCEHCQSYFRPFVELNCTVS